MAIDAGKKGRVRMRQSVFWATLFVCSSVFFMAVALAQEAGLSVASMRAEPASVAPGGKVLLSCRVTHPGGAGAIERVAATVSGKERMTSFTMLYDDATHGDRSAGDGVYSLRIRAPKAAGEYQIVFQAVGRDRREVESQPLFLTVKP